MKVIQWFLALGLSLFLFEFVPLHPYLLLDYPFFPFIAHNIDTLVPLWWLVEG